MVKAVSKLKRKDIQLNWAKKINIINNDRNKDHLNSIINNSNNNNNNKKFLNTKIEYMNN